MFFILKQYLITFGWALTGAISMAVSFGIMFKVLTWLTPIDEWEELKKGNMAVGLYIAAIVVSVAFVIGLTVMS